jgi:ParB-like partition proteins
MLGIMDELDINKIRKSMYCYRSINGGDEELCSSLIQNGLLQPIVVRPKENYFEIIAGNRRYAACKRLGWRKIPCHIIELDDKEAHEVSIVENVQRNNLTIIDEARTYKAYVSNFGWGGISDLAAKIGKSIHYVERRIKLLDLPDNVLGLITSRDLNPSTAEELFFISDKSRQSDLAKLVITNQLSSRKVRKLVKKYRSEISQVNDVYIFNATTMQDVDEAAQRAFDKSISVLKIAIQNLTLIIQNVEENWIIYETLKHHRDILHNQIDLLIREKKKI